MVEIEASRLEIDFDEAYYELKIATVVTIPPSIQGSEGMAEIFANLQCQRIKVGGFSDTLNWYTP